MTARVRQRPGAAMALLASPLAAQLVTEAAEDVADYAAGFVPVDKGYSRKGYTSTVAKLTARGLVATAYTAEVTGHLHEWGSVNTPVLAPLRRGAERAGLRTRLASGGNDA